MIRSSSSNLLRITISAALLPPAAAFAKEEHFQKIRVLLMTEKATCTSCHVSATSKDLNKYGLALAAEGKDEPLAERMALLDKDAPESASAGEKDKQKKRQDIDGDGVPNWVEVLAGSNPGDKSSVPDTKQAERVLSVVSCTICHTGTNLPGSNALESNPHNELGKLLARTLEPKDRASVGKDAEAIRQKASRTPILKRFKIVAMKPTGGAKPNYWERLLLFYSPADTRESPEKEAVVELRRMLKAQKNVKTRDAARGMGPHKPDGFLLDLK